MHKRTASTTLLINCSKEITNKFRIWNPKEDQNRSDSEVPKAARTMTSHSLTQKVQNSTFWPFISSTLTMTGNNFTFHEKSIESCPYSEERSHRICHLRMKKPVIIYFNFSWLSNYTRLRKTQHLNHRSSTPGVPLNHGNNNRSYWVNTHSWRTLRCGIGTWVDQSKVFFSYNVK